MIAKANAISHGSISINYITRMGTANVVMIKFMPEDTPAEAIWNHMQAHRLAFQHKRSVRKPLKDDTIRIEISPAREETEGWTMNEWKQLVADFVRAFDAIDLSTKAKRPEAKRTTLGNTQLIATLHNDSDSGILHLHIDANRVDMDGNLIDAHHIGMRAVMAANEVTRQRKWVQAKQRSGENKHHITKDCLDILRDIPDFLWSEYASRLSAKGYDVRLKRDSFGTVRGYSIRMGNSVYKSSEIDRCLMPSRIEDTWKDLRYYTYPQPSPAVQPKSTDVQQPKNHEFSFRFDYNEYNGYTVRNEDNVHNGYNGRSEAINIIVHIGDTVYNAMTSEAATLSGKGEDHTDAVKVALLLFASYIDAATAMSESCGGGGSPTSGWGKDKDEDENEWARCCARMAHQMLHTPKRRRGLGR